MSEDLPPPRTSPMSHPTPRPSAFACSDSLWPVLVRVHLRVSNIFMITKKFYGHLSKHEEGAGGEEKHAHPHTLITRRSGLLVFFQLVFKEPHTEIFIPNARPPFYPGSKRLTGVPPTSPQQLLQVPSSSLGGGGLRARLPERQVESCGCQHRPDSSELLQGNSTALGIPWAPEPLDAEGPPATLARPDTLHPSDWTNWGAPAPAVLHGA